MAYCVSLIVLAFIVNTGLSAYAQNQTKKKNQIQEEKSFNRPEPKKPIKPEVPSTNRYQEDKLFLEYDDSLYKVNNYRDTTEKQILKGNVKFRQAGMWMFCDSAYYYPNLNSLDAFSNVKMEQGDTLFVYADKMFYNGDMHQAKLENGPTRAKVTLINKDVTLTTDSLDYNVEMDLGWYTRWGTIDDKVNTLTSLYGEYSPRTKRAEFYHDVVLVNNRDGYRMLTDTLHYNTATHIANIESRTEIQSENDTIITNLATYYTDTGDADLLSRSMIIHRDSTGNVVTLEGDSIVYDSKTRISRAYMFRSSFKIPTPMVINDTAQKTRLIGGFGIYNDSTREAMATYYPLLIEYSRPDDTLFLRADVIKTYTVMEMVADKKRKTKSGFPEFKGMPIVRADSGGIWIDTSFFKVTIPYIDTPLTMLLKALPPKKEPTAVVEELAVVQDSISEGVVEWQDSLFVATNDSIFLSPGEDGQMEDKAELMKEIIRNNHRHDSLQRNSKELDIGEAIAETEEQDTVLQVDSIPYESHVVLAYHRGRFFKKDMQGVADSMVFIEKDSMLYLFRKPIVWSGERQVTGNRIDVHFNDSTTDWAYLPEFGLISELVDEDFYNQIYGKEITAYFENQGLRRMSVSGNVETIFLPQEEDSTYNRLVNAESSFMEVYMDSTKLDWLKMWPEVSGSVTPIFLVKRAQMYLQKFRWWNFLRPERAWYGDQMKWVDNLGEVPDALEQYFLAPSDFGEPKSFSATRWTPPPGTLPIWEDFPEVDLSDVDDIDTVTETLDSLQNSGINIESLPDSLPASMHHEIDAETLHDIEQREENLEKEAEEIEEQTESIEEEVAPELEPGIIKQEESAIIEQEEEEADE